MKRLSLGFVAVLVLTLSMGVSAQSTESQPIKPALLVIDVQKAYLPMMDASPMSTRVINGVIALFRRQGLPVIRVYHTDSQWGPAPDSEGFQFDSSIQITDSDPQIVKHYGNAFKKTELDSVLKAQNVNTVFCCGLSATGCVLATYHGAVDLDYRVFMVKGGLMSPKQSLTEAVEEMLPSMDYSAIALLLDALVR